MIVGVAPRCGGGEFFGGRTLASADEDSVLAQVLEQIFGYVARGDREWEAAVIAEIERVAARGDCDERVRLAWGPRGNVIDAVGARDVPVLVGDGGDRGGGGCVAVRAGFDEDVAGTAARVGGKIARGGRCWSGCAGM